jgi:hypothetical protein
MKSKYSLAILIFACVFAQPALTQTIQEIKSCVSFIYLPNAKGELVPNGTGFFVSIDDTIRDQSYVYTITSKHVLWDTATKAFVPNAWLRLNTKAGDADFVRQPMRTTGDLKNVFVHTDSTVDLVAVLGIPNPEKYSFTTIPSELIRTGHDIKSLGLGEGTDVFFPALFVPHIGEHKNYPIVRFGKLALVSDERISWDRQLQRLFLIESISIGGHSGAPVFIWFEPRQKQGEPVMYGQKLIRLIGVIQGFFEFNRALGFQQTAIIPVYGSHTGISAVVPVEQMQEILFGPEATKVRDKLSAASPSKTGQVRH